MNNLGKALVYASRSIVGSLFIVSGLIKMNDSYGFSYKLEEYFSEKALNFPDLIPYSLGLAVFICIAEVLLGVAVLVWAKQKLSTLLILILILFFTWLTYYTHTCDPLEKVTLELGGEMVETTRDCVLSCGCFGNAIPLTPYESFLKDLFLLVWTSIIFVYAWFIEKKEHFDLSVKKNKQDYLIVLAISLLSVAVFSLKLLDWMFPVLFTGICIFVAEFIRKRSKSELTDWWVAGAVAVVCGIFAYTTYNYLPMKDYRPYAEGQNIIENMKTAEELGLEGPVYATEYTVTNKATGKDSIMLSTDWLKVYSTDWFKNTYEKEMDYDGAEVLVKDGYSPLISDFAPMDFSGENRKDEVLNYEGNTLIIVSKDMKVWMDKDQAEVKALVDQFKNAGQRVIALVNGASMEEINAFKAKTGLEFDFYLMDDVELKTMIRSNPGFIHMHNATIVQKWSWKGMPEFSDIALK